MLGLRSYSTTLSPSPLFITHSAKLSGAELSLMDTASRLATPPVVLVLDNGPLVEALRQRGLQVATCPLNRRLAGVRRQSSALRSLLAFATGLQVVVPMVRARRSHAVTVAHSQKAFVLSALVQPLVRRPLVWALQDILHADQFDSGLLRLAVALANRAVERVVANSRATGDAFLAAGGHPDKLEVVLQGVDTVPFAAARPAPDLVAVQGPPGEGAGSSRRLRIGCFSRLASWKGQDVLLRALAQVPFAEAWIVGAPLFGEDAFAGELRDLAARLGVEERVRFLGFRADVPAVMAACDVVCHTSTAPEPFGRVIVEGMAAGKPVIAAAAGGVLEIVTDGRDGLLVPPGDATALAAALRRLHDEPGLATRLTENGRARSLAFGADRRARQLEAILSAVGASSNGHLFKPPPTVPTPALPTIRRTHP